MMTPSSPSSSVAAEDGDASRPDEPTLSERVVTVVRKCPGLVVRPTRLAAQLGISIDDASAELCGLLAAVGAGATFSFEHNKDNKDDPPVMVFRFPPDFVEKADRHVRRRSRQETVLRLARSALQGAKVILAFGLILSLTLVAVVAVVVLVSVLIGVSRSGGNNNNRRHLNSTVRRWLGTVRQLLWCYAIFGGAFDNSNNNNGENEQQPQYFHPFFREVAMIMAGVLTVCSGGGLSPFFWMRMGRRRRYGNYGGWGRRRHEPTGYELTNTGTWPGELQEEEDTRQGQQSSAANNSQDTLRGFLSVATEFLFGPTPPFAPKPTERLKWRLRAARILLSERAESSLEQMAPFADVPPSSLEDRTAVVAAGLRSVAHFNGVPATHGADTFRFPELQAEAEDGGLPSPKTYESATETPVTTWRTLFCRDGTHAGSYEPASTREDDKDNVPSYLHEQRHVLTTLTARQFHTCLLLGVVNFLGVRWIRGVLLFSSPWAHDGSVAGTLVGAVLSLLVFYSSFFFFLPFVRLCVVLFLNVQVDRRNDTRKRLAQSLLEKEGDGGNGGGESSKSQHEIIFL